VRENRTHGSTRGRWCAGYVRAREAPPTERGGNRQACPNPRHQCSTLPFNSAERQTPAGSDPTPAVMVLSRLVSMMTRCGKPLNDITTAASGALCGFQILCWASWANVWILQGVFTHLWGESISRDRWLLTQGSRSLRSGPSGVSESWTQRSISLPDLNVTPCSRSTSVSIMATW
jgi:hypothetical protein